MFLKVKPPVEDSQVISIFEIKQQKLANDVQALFLPVAKQLAMYLFSSIPVTFEIFTENKMLEGVIHDIINFDCTKDGNFCVTPFLVIKNDKKLYSMCVGYSLSILKWSCAFNELSEDGKSKLIYGSYCNDLDELVKSFSFQLECLVPRMIEKLNCKVIIG
jgi:hypothetical protein